MVKRILKTIGIVLALLVLCLIVLLGYWRFRPNRAVVDEALVKEVWPAVSDGEHNSNTDMIFHNGSYYMVHAASPFHFASDKCRLVVRKSADGREWEELAVIRNPGEDIRDPKFFITNPGLGVYVLRNSNFAAEPYDTFYSVSPDGEGWSPISSLGHEGWLFWRPKTLDGETWYLPAYWWQHGKSQLLSSTDGVSWDVVSPIHTSPVIPGDFNDETAVEFLSDGRMISTARIEVGQELTGNREGYTLISVAEPPYTEWRETARDPQTRLDGPALFRYRDEVFAVGRRHVDNTPLKYRGSILARYRTALYHVSPEGLTHLTDLPSAGDTAYAGVVVEGNEALVCYYTGRTDRDWPWIMGMLSASDIMMARLDLDEALARVK